jgi:hypothetical protein
MNALKIRSWFRAKGFSYSDIERMKAKSKVFNRYYYMAMDEIGDRREIGALEKKLDPSVVKFTMPLYDPDWKAQQVADTLLKQQAEGRAEGTIIVNMAPIPAVAATQSSIEIVEDKTD